MSGLQQTLDRLIAMRSEARAKRQRILDRAESEGREELTPDETRAFRALTKQLEGEDDEEGLDARIGFLHAEVQRGLTGPDPANAELLAALGGKGRGGTERPGASPIRFGEQQLRQMHQDLLANRPGQVELRAFESPDSLLPSQLWPYVVREQEHETRLLSRLPVFPASAPSIEYIQHQNTTGAAAVTAEGQPKPEIVMGLERVIAQIVKIAAHTAVSWEILSDWVNFATYVQSELILQVVDVESYQLINGTGGGTELDGFLGTSGILTYSAPGSGSTPQTPLDGIESAIAVMRTGPALCQPDLLVLHPNTWSALRKQKDLYGRYLIAADPTKDTADSVWGVDVLTTTQIAAGAGLMLDTQKFGRVHMRESLFIRWGYTNDDMTRNLVRYVGEERLQLAVEQPAAVLSITGLPTS